MVALMSVVGGRSSRLVFQVNTGQGGQRGSHSCTPMTTPLSTSESGLADTACCPRIHIDDCALRDHPRGQSLTERWPCWHQPQDRDLMDQVAVPAAGGTPLTPL
jgi:hypothetical protein